MFNDDSWENKLKIQWAEATAGNPQSTAAMLYQTAVMWGETRGGSITLSSPKRHFGLQTVNLHKTLNEYIFGHCMLYNRERESNGWREKQVVDKHAN